MINLIVFILACAGLTQILCYGKIFDNVRPRKGFFGELFSCSMCIGFHIGYALFLLFWYFNISLFPNIFAGSFIFAAVSSFTSYFLDKAISDEGIAVKAGNKTNIKDYPYDKWV